MTHVAVEGLRLVRDGRVVLDLPALEFPDGSTTAIFGPNGSGKTSLLRVIAGLEQPAAGRVVLGPAADRHPVAFAFQQAVFLRGTVRHNLALGLELRGVGESERANRIAEVAQECGIDSLLERSTARLSSGEAQRVNLARTLALRAPVTLLDEPLAGVDRIGRQALLEDLPRLVATFAATTIIVTHDREEAFRLADRLVVLVAGKVRAAGRKREIYRRPPDAETAELLGYTILPGPDGLLAIPPDGLRLGPGDPQFQLRVGRMVEMESTRLVTGTIGETPAELRLAEGESSPAPQSLVEVHAVGAVPLPVLPPRPGSGYVAPSGRGGRVV